MKLVYSDRDVIVVDKPPGQHTQPPAGGAGGSLLDEAKAGYGPQIRLVHRLDRDASGLVILARNRAVAATLGDAFRAHTVRRTYRAELAVPLPVGTSGTIDRALKWSGGRCWADPSGVSAVTHYEVVEREGPRSVLEIRLETGRMHQIRVHLAAALAPLVGDRKYGGPKADRLALRAIRLELDHPVTGRPLRCEVSPLPSPAESV